MSRFIAAVAITVCFSAAAHAASATTQHGFAPTVIPAVSNQSAVSNQQNNQSRASGSSIGGTQTPTTRGIGGHASTSFGVYKPQSSIRSAVQFQNTYTRQSSRKVQANQIQMAADQMQAQADKADEARKQARDHAQATKDAIRKMLDQMSTINNGTNF